MRVLPVDALVDLPALRMLALDACGLASWPLPPLPGALDGLAELSLRGNPLALLPSAAFVPCPNLRRLDLSGACWAAICFLSIL